MSNSGKFIDERLSVSITAYDPPSNPVDRTAPLTFQEWVKYNNNLFTNYYDFLLRYQSYLNNWYEIKNYSKEDRIETSRLLYTSLISEVILSYSSSEEKRFLKNIDLNNSSDLAIAVPFFAKKLKDICLYFTTLRDDVKSATIRFNLKGSNYGIEKLVYNEISKSLEAEDLTSLTRSLNLSLSSIRNNLVIDIEDLFDEFSNYLDVSTTLPQSAYEPIDDFRNTYYPLNQYDIKPNLFLDFSTAIVQAISSYPFYLIELGDNNFTITPKLSSSQLNYLKDSDFINTINNEQENNLNLNIQKLQIQKYIGTDFYYLSTGTTSNNYISGSLFVADNEFANYLNKRYPSVAAVPSSNYIKTAKQIGLFFKPDKLGLTTATNFGLTFKVNSLSANTVYIFPDPSKYGNISGLTEEEFTSPFTFTEWALKNKTDFSNQYRFGDSITSNYFQTFRGYQSREQSLDTSIQGVTRYTDPQEFFKSDLKNNWANGDVFPVIPQNTLPIENRIEKLLSINYTAVQYKTDIYGNEYVLYKDVFPQKDTTTPVIKDYFICLLIDGHTFYDLVSGYNFNYNQVDVAKGYSGVTTKTSMNIPPGSGYYDPYFNTYDNGAPEFLLSGYTTPIVSYRLQPESFCPSFVELKFDCSFYDGTRFMASSSVFLQDFPSDSPLFTDNTVVYYEYVIDGGASPYGNNWKPTIIAPAVFSFVPPYTAYQVKDGGRFLYNGAAACGDEVDFNPRYNEKSNFANFKISNKETKYLSVSGLKSKKTIYDSRNKIPGHLYYRNSNSSLIYPLSTALSSIFTRYTDDIEFELNNKIINFDVIYDILQFETENYLVLTKISFDYETNTVKSAVINDAYFYKGDCKGFENTSTVWFNEKENILVVCKTNLFYDLSATNYKIIYPEIFTININNLQVTKLYPNERILTFETLQDYSLLYNNVNINIVSVEKPVLNYDNETELYCMSYIGKDISEVFYLFKVYFKFVNGVITNITNNMYKLTPDVDSINFSNFVSDLSSRFIVNVIAGPGNSIDTPGYIDTNKGVYVLKSILNG
jgi:hypothetical protein